ncbi:FecR family protein [Pedobacter metabolipauper]|uniref:FecR family protein n=1 Tax=Pedobacter metabolipauper TaxID=425513 RepID=A0A4R6T0C0_9SPHI|nr:FecR family protein [Pedobacter metabolipauper]TDQ10265.1 FecR family protein [Pedobacter metabolipauper]
MSDRLSYLFEKQLLQESSAKEKLELLTLMADQANEQQTESLLADHWDAFDADRDQKEPVFQPGQGEEILNSILTAHIYPAQATAKPVRLWPRIFVAAAVILLIFGVYFYTHTSSVNDDLKKTAYTNDIAPGKNGATLTLSNGQKIIITDAHAGNIAKQSGVKISKTADGRIIYELIDKNSGSNEFNTLSSARGEQTQVRLPDGSIVFLNAESSLKYPTSFARLKQRAVFLTGEGYFEVAKDQAHPFIVTTTNQKVEVLGTHFNINAYPGQASSKTTLIEGKVTVTGKQDVVILTPNEQAVTTTGKTRVKQVNTSNYTAWLDGKFSFDDKTFEETMSEIGRWYDLDIVYEHGIPEEELIGDAFRNQNISFVLRLLDVAEIDYKLDAARRKLTINGKKNRK